VVILCYTDLAVVCGMVSVQYMQNTAACDVDYVDQVGEAEHRLNSLTQRVVIAELVSISD